MPTDNKEEISALSGTGGSATPEGLGDVELEFAMLFGSPRSRPELEPEPEPELEPEPETKPGSKSFHPCSPSASRPIEARAARTNSTGSDESVCEVAGKGAAFFRRHLAASHEDQHRSNSSTLNGTHWRTV